MCLATPQRGKSQTEERTINSQRRVHSSAGSTLMTTVESIFCHKRHNSDVCTGTVHVLWENLYFKQARTVANTTLTHKYQRYHLYGGGTSRVDTSRKWSFHKLSTGTAVVANLRRVQSHNVLFPADTAYFPYLTSGLPLSRSNSATWKTFASSPPIARSSTPAPVPLPVEGDKWIPSRHRR